MWSYGCYAFELATGSPPFKGKQFHELYQAIKNEYHGSIDSTRWSANFQDFIDSCLKKDKNERATIDEILEHPFLSQMNHEECLEAFKSEYTYYVNKHENKS